MPRLLVALAIVGAFARDAPAEFVARAKDFKCLQEFTPVPGKSLVIHHRNRASSSARSASPPAT